MKTKFTNSANLPDYLEEALAPLTWSGIFSGEFQQSVFTVIMSFDQPEVVESFIRSTSCLEFLSKSYKRFLFDALRRWAKERDKPAK